MAALSNPKHELFAQGLATGMPQIAAYERVGYAPNDGHAARLAGNGKVAARVRELQAEGQERNGVTVDSLTRRYDEAIEQATADKAHAAVMAGLAGQAKLHGLIIDKAKVEQGRLDEMSDAAIAADIENRLARIAAGRTEGAGEASDGTGPPAEPEPARDLQPISETD